MVAGAGFGILSAHVAYLTQRHRWGRRPAKFDGLSVAPAYGAGGLSLCLAWHPK